MLSKGKTPVSMPIGLRIVQRIQALTGNLRPQGTENLAGYADRYRIRQGRYRITILLMTNVAT